MEIVNLQSFFDNLTILADAPNGIVKLRQLILQLAVRGKLVPQNPNDESAASLATAIAQEKTYIDKTGANKNGSIKGELKFGDAPFSLPETWVWQRVEDVFYSISPGQNKIKSSEIRESGRFPVVDQGKKFIAGFIDDASKLIKIPGPVVIFGDHTCELKLVNFDFVAGADGVKIMRPIHIYEPYFFRVTQTFKFGERGYSRHYKLFLANLFPLPPLEEQKRIVAKVDELMQLCDELEVRERRRRKSCVRLNEVTLAPLNNPASLTPEGFEQASVGLADNFTTLYDSVETVGKLRSTILELGVQGKLAEQYPDDEAILAKGESPDARDMLFQSPRNWVWARFGEIAEIVSGVTKGRKLNGRKTALYPYLRVANVQRWFLDLRVMKEIEILEDEIEKYRLKKNDLLITEGGDWDKVGRTAIWNDEIENCVHQNHVFRARLLRSDISPIWVMTFLNSATGRTYFERASKQTTNLASINMRQLRACPIAVPPLAEQKRIVAKVNQLISLCDELETKLRQTEAESEKLMNAAVQHVLDAVTEAHSSNGSASANHKHSTGA